MAQRTHTNPNKMTVIVRLGTRVMLGDGVRLGTRVMLGDGVRLGDGVELGTPGSPYWCAGRDPRGYEVIGYLRADMLRVIAGCRDFTVEDAKAHWSDPGHQNPDAAADILLKIAYLEAACRRFRDIAAKGES